MGSLRLGALQVDPSRNVIANNVSSWSIEPKIMDLLVVLAAHPGEVMSRDALIAQVWKVEFGADESLTRAVSQLRKTFREAGETVEWIETIPKRGYRLVGPPMSEPAVPVVSHRMDGQIPEPEAPSTALPPTAIAQPPDPAALPSETPLVERRQVTVLSCIVFDTDDARRDPEDWREVVLAFQADAARIVSQFDGHVQHAQGDALTVFFGDTQSREDDAQRAVRAGLAVADAVSAAGKAAAPSVRIGIATGSIIVATARDASYGAALTLAMRLAGQADANAVLVSPATASLVSGYFDLETLAGRAFRVAGALATRTRFDISRARGLSQFVGRANDLRLLDTALRNAENGHGQAIGVVAEAGTGKSRLCFEFLAQCRARGFQVFEGRAVAHGRSIPLLPILDVFRAFFDIGQTDDDATARVRIETRLLALDSKLGDAAPLVFDFLGVADPSRPSPPLDPDVRQRQLIGLLCHMIKLAGAERPTVILIEDLHWLDSASAQFLEHMVAAQADASGVLLLNFRPEFRADWMQTSSYLQIPLAPLGRDAVGEMLVDLLGDDASLMGLTPALQARTGGNPFFIEEIVQTLIETGQLEGARGAYQLATAVASLDVPPTVKAVLAARMDRLDARERQLLQSASVIGKNFSERLLVAVANLSTDAFAAALAGLRRGEFIHEQSLFPVAAFAFKHPLTQEVALGTLLKDRRRLIHADVARALEAQDADRLDERAALLAHHWEEAGETVAAARWHSRAATWAGFTNPAEALRHWQRARALLRAAPQTPETVSLGVAACMGALGLSWRLGSPKADITAVFEEGLRLAEASADITAQAMMNGVYGCFLGLVEGESDAYCHYSREAIRLAEQTDDLGLQISQRSFFGFGAASAGRLDEGLVSCAWALANLPNDPDLGRQLSGYSPYLGLLQTHAWMLVRSGRLDEAEAAAEKTAALAAEFGDFEVHTSLQLPNLDLAVARADVAAARQHANTARLFSEKSGTPQSRMIGLATHGAACRLEGRWDEAVAASSAAVEAATRGANANMEGWVRAELALALLGRGDIDKAEQQALLAADIARAKNSRCDEVSGLLAFVHVQITRGTDAALARAEGALERAALLVDDFQLNIYRPDLHEGRGRIALWRDDPVEGLRDMRAAEQLCRGMGAPLRADRLQAEFPA